MPSLLHIKKTRLSILIVSAFMSQPLLAADFTIIDGQVVTTQQVLGNFEKGIIETGGQLAVGSTAINATGSNNVITNNGSITTAGNLAHGVSSTGTGATITNSGSITMRGTNSHGILSIGATASITNSGSITTADAGANGVVSFGSNDTITNSGSITTAGINARGIFSQGANVSITNSGSITTTGASALGIFTQGTNVSITNSGSITTTGAGAFGIFSSGANTTITNSGLISATGANSLAVSGASNTTLNLLPGSQIIGRIDLGNNGGDNDTANVYGGVSANLTFENTENINLFGTGVVSGSTVVTVDATGESTRGVALSSITSSIHGIISQRMAHSAPLKPVQLASLTLSPDMYFEAHKPVAWAQVFGGRFDRDAEGSALSYDYNHAGINFGYEWDVNQTRVGLMGGIVVSDTKSQTASFKTEANNYYLGVYGNHKVMGVNITASLLAGYGDHDNDRLVLDNLNGSEVAQSDFGSVFISPSLTIASAYIVADRLELRPSASLSYSIAWLDDYSERGTTNSNLSIDDRKAKALIAKVQLAAAYALSQSSEFEFRVGVNSRHTDDDDTNVSIAGSQFTFANAGDENVTGGFAGANLRVANENNLVLVADVEFGGNSDEDYAAGNISLEYVF